MKIVRKNLPTTSPQTHPAENHRKIATLPLNHRHLRARPRRNITGKERDSETGLYYYGARYLDPKASRWLSGDPAVGEYVPSAPASDEARKRNGGLPGMGGVFNYVNMHVYHYGGNNPVKYTDPNGRELGYDPENKTIFCDSNPDDLDRARIALNIIDPVTHQYVYDKVFVTGNNGFTRESNNLENTVYENTRDVNSEKYTVTTTIRNELGQVTVKYVINNGNIAFDLSEQDYQSVLSIGGGRTLAIAMYDEAKRINSEHLDGRTVGGIDVEMRAHWYFYKFTGNKRAEMANIGGINSDTNARIFE